MTTTLATTHPLLGAARAASSALGDMVDLEPMFMTTHDKQAAIIALARVEAQAAELRLRMLASADDVADAVDSIPTDLGQELIAKAEATLIDFAATHPPKELKQLGDHIIEIVAPEVGEAEDAKRLEAIERLAQGQVSVRVYQMAPGRRRLIIDTTDTVAERLIGILDAYASPRRTDKQESEPTSEPESGEREPIHRRRGRAFQAFLDHLDPTTLPNHGGTATTLLITCTYESLISDVATATVIGNDEITISASQARRLACEAGIRPLVLGADSEPLDLGRERRLFTRAQRLAIRQRDRGCVAEGCDTPPTWTEAHHLNPWTHGGNTDINDSASLCAHHHDKIHDHHYRWQRQPDGQIRFKRTT